MFVFVFAFNHTTHIGVNDNSSVLCWVAGFSEFNGGEMTNLRGLYFRQDIMGRSVEREGERGEKGRRAC